MKRTDCAHIVEAKGIQGDLLGQDEDRFFRLAEGDIGGHRDFRLRTCDVRVTLEDNVLIVPKDPQVRPFLDMDYFKDDHHHNIISTIATPEQAANIAKAMNDRTRHITKVRFYLRGDLYDKAREIADEAGFDDVDEYIGTRVMKVLENL